MNPQSPFRIQEEVGSSSTSVVYRAWQESLQRSVALKCYRPGSDARRVQERIDAEVAATSRLHHPGIAFFIESGTLEDPIAPISYLAREFVDGATIDRHCAERELSRREITELLIQTCDALDHAHRHGVLHGDLSPSNVLVTAEGRVKLIDFGHVSSAPGAFSGKDLSAARVSLHYCAPECLRMPGPLPEVRQDVYALGAIAHHLFSGSPPFQLESPIDSAIAARREQPTVPPLREIDKTIPRDLEAIVLCAMAPQAEHRYADVRSLTTDLHRHLRNQPVSARSLDRKYRVYRAAQRLKGLFASLLLLSTGLVASHSGRVRALEQNDQLGQAIDDLTSVAGEIPVLIAHHRSEKVDRTDERFSKERITADLHANPAELPLVILTLAQDLVDEPGEERAAFPVAGALYELLDGTDLETFHSRLNFARVLVWRAQQVGNDSLRNDLSDTTVEDALELDRKAIPVLEELAKELRNGDGLRRSAPYAVQIVELQVKLAQHFARFGGEVDEYLEQFGAAERLLAEIGEPEDTRCQRLRAHLLRSALWGKGRAIATEDPLLKERLTALAERAYQDWLGFSEEMIAPLLKEAWTSLDEDQHEMILQFLDTNRTASQYAMERNEDRMQRFRENALLHRHNITWLTTLIHNVGPHRALRRELAFEYSVSDRDRPGRDESDYPLLRKSLSILLTAGLPMQAPDYSDCPEVRYLRIASRFFQLSEDPSSREAVRQLAEHIESRVRPRKDWSFALLAAILERRATMDGPTSDVLELSRAVLKRVPTLLKKKRRVNAHLGFLSRALEGDDLGDELRAEYEVELETWKTWLEENGP